MAWRALTPSDVHGVLSDAELDALDAAARPQGIGPHIEAQISAVTATIRGYIAGCPRNTLGPAGTLPLTLHHTALAILAVDIPARFAGLNFDPHEIRRNAKRDALRLLADVAACRFEVEGATTGATPAAPTPPSAYTKPRVSTRERLKGVM